MSGSKIISISALKSVEIDETKDASDVCDLPIYRGVGHDVGSGFFAGPARLHGSTASKTYRCVFDTLLAFPNAGTAIELPDSHATLSPLDGIFIPGGMTFNCRLPEQFLFVTREVGAEYASTVENAVTLSSGVPLDIASATRAASAFVGPVPEQKRSETLQVSENSTAGMWGSSIYHRKASEFPRFEFMFLQQGAYVATLQGKTLHFKTGDLFFVEKGANASFETDGPVRKIYWSLG